jgi:hypothetical protein
MGRICPFPEGKIQYFKTPALRFSHKYPVITFAIIKKPEVSSGFIISCYALHILKDRMHKPFLVIDAFFE